MALELIGAVKGNRHLFAGEKIAAVFDLQYEVAGVGVGPAQGRVDEDEAPARVAPRTPDENPNYEARQDDRKRDDEQGSVRHKIRKNVPLLAELGAELICQPTAFKFAGKKPWIVSNIPDQRRLLSLLDPLQAWWHVYGVAKESSLWVRN